MEHGAYFVALRLVVRLFLELCYSSVQPLNGSHDLNELSMAAQNATLAHEYCTKGFAKTANASWPPVAECEGGEPYSCFRMSRRVSTLMPDILLPFLPQVGDDCIDKSR